MEPKRLTDVMPWGSLYVDDETRRTDDGSLQAPDSRGAAAANIVEVCLTEGARILKRPYRLAASGDGTERGSSENWREPARVITMAWGDRYIDDLVEITIPALLAPGNLPAFAEQFDCEFVIVTETRLFDRLARSAAIAALLNFVDLRLVPIDDLLSPWYGITLTYALVRGFADLGAAMMETHLVFLNADFIVADGSYRKLAEIIKRGERLVVSPSYCMNLEDTIDALRRRRDPTSWALSLSHRELADIIIANRHNTIRAKTVNQRMFRIHRYDQFYWYVNEKTLLGRQMPIAVVYMRPERVLTELPTFWDYGVISEYCPTVKPWVFADSDDFLMGELRSEGTFRELLHLGWPTVDEIAADLTSFTTKDHRDYGRHTLILHGDELPSDIDAAKGELANFVDGVYARLKPAISYRDHPFWAPQFPLFYARHQEALLQRKADEAAKATLLREDPREAARQQQIEELRSEILAMEQKIRFAQQQLAEKLRSGQIRLSQIEEEDRRRRAAVERDIQLAIAGEEAGLRKLHDRLKSLDTASAGLGRRLNCAVRRLRIGAATDADKPLNSPATAPVASPDSAGRHIAGKALVTFLTWCACAYRKAFGALPRTTRWHPYHTMLRPVMAAVASAADAHEVLLVSSGGIFASLIVSDLSGRKLTIAAGMLDSEYYQQSFRDRPGFDLCFCDLAVDDLVRFRMLFERIIPLLNKRSRIIVFHENRAGRLLDDWTHEFARGLFPLNGRSQIAFAGSRPGALSIRWFAKSLERHNVSRPSSVMMLAVTLAICAPLARLASGIEQRRPPHRMPSRCTSMTIEIDLP
jgi:hypothetical protein